MGSRSLLVAGFIASMAVLVGAGIVAAVAVFNDSGNESDANTSRSRNGDVRGEGVIRLTPDPLTEAEQAEEDDSADLPGTFVPSQGRGHFESGFMDQVMTLFCEGVRRSDLADRKPTPAPITPISPGAPSQYQREDPEFCYASNPPSSGTHIGVERNVDIGGGRIINIPPDPDVYPHDVEIPRDAIPHILEHSGVFVGHNCADGDAACEEVVRRIEDVVNERIDNFDDRVVMARDTDLPVGEMGLSAWTRVMNFRYQDYDEEGVMEFIATHSCRYDPEGFC